MNKFNFTDFIKNVQTSVTKHSPEILTGIGIAGMIATAVIAVKATPKALRCIEAKKQELETEELCPVDTVKATWKCYIPAAVTCAASVTCLIGSTSVHARRNAALATAYKISETAYKLTEDARKEYRDKVIETIGEKKEQAIRDHIAKDKIEKNPVKNHEVIITAKGDTLCYDGMFGRYFKSDIETIRRAINQINRDILTQDYASLNDFYNEIGLSPTEMGDHLGWNIDDGQLEPDFSSQLAEDGTPCLVIGFNVAPKYNYNRLF